MDTDLLLTGLQQTCAGSANFTPLLIRNSDNTSTRYVSSLSTIQRNRNRLRDQVTEDIGHKIPPRLGIENQNTTENNPWSDFIVNGYVLPVVMKSLFHGTGWVPFDVGHLPLLARLSGTLCRRTCVIRMFLRTFTGSHWRRFYFRSTSVFSALQVFYENALYKFTFDIDIEKPHLIVFVKILDNANWFVQF